MSNFSQKQSKLQLLLGNPYNDTDVTTSLRLGCSRSPTVDTTTTKIDNSDIILKDENSVNTLCIFINFLMSSTSVHSVLHANIHDLIATDSIASFMSLVIHVTTELHHNECFRKNDDKFVLFGMFVERLRYLYQCSTTSNYHNNTDNENDLVYIKSNQNVYSTVTRCKRLQHSITVKLPELDEVLSSFLLDTGRKTNDESQSTITTNHIFNVLFLLRTCVSLSGEYSLLQEDKQQLLTSLKTPLLCVSHLLSMYEAVQLKNSHEKTIWSEINSEEKDGKLLHIIYCISEVFSIMNRILTWNYMLPSPIYMPDSILSQIFHPTMSSLFESNINIIKTLCVNQKKLLEAQFSKHTTFLFPGMKYTGTSSPMIIPNAFSVKGDYTLGFWIYLPSLRNLQHHKLLGKSIHLLSRVQETGDFDLNALVRSKNIPDNSDNDDDDAEDDVDDELCYGFNPSIRLHVNKEGACKVLVKTSARPKVIKLSSETLPTGRWLNFHVGVVLDPTPTSTSTSTSTIGTDTSKQVQTDSGEFFLHVNIGDDDIKDDSDKHRYRCSMKARFLRVSPHQNVFVGQIPSSIFPTCTHDTYNVAVDTTTNLGIRISDITWNPIKFIPEQNETIMQCPPSVLSTCMKTAISNVDRYAHIYMYIYIYIYIYA